MFRFKDSGNRGTLFSVLYTITLRGLHPLSVSSPKMILWWFLYALSGITLSDKDISNIDTKYFSYTFSNIY